MCTMYTDNIKGLGVYYTEVSTPLMLSGLIIQFDTLETPTSNLLSGGSFHGVKS
jgi:hypothetical protein